MNIFAKIGPLCKLYVGWCTRNLAVVLLCTRPLFVQRVEPFGVATHSVQFAENVLLIPIYIHHEGSYYIS